MSQENENYTVSINELKIKNGENTIYGKIYAPVSDGKFPVIILSHGYNGSNNDFTSDCKYYAKNGFIAYTFDFCGGSVNSKSTGTTTDMTILSEKSDVLAIFHYISAMDIVDENNVFLFGGSQGGLVTALSAAELKDKVRAVALYFPAFGIVDNWRKTYPYIEDIPDTNDFWGMKLGKNFFVTMHDFYPMDEIGAYEENVLIVHGDKDAIVSLDYSKKAVEIYKNAELVTMPGEGHGFTLVAGNKARKYVLDFIVENTVSADNKDIL